MSEEATRLDFFIFPQLTRLGGGHPGPPVHLGRRDPRTGLPR